MTVYNRRFSPRFSFGILPIIATCFGILFIFVFTKTLYYYVVSRKPSITETTILGYKVKHIDYLRNFDNCQIFSIGVDEKMIFEKELNWLIGANCKIHAYTERSLNIKKTDIPLQQLIIRDEHDLIENDQKLPVMTLNELAHVKSGNSNTAEVALIKLDIGMRAIDLITSRSLSILPCQVLIRIKLQDKKQLRKVVLRMRVAMFYLQVLRSKPQKKEKIYYFTFCSLHCAGPGFECDYRL